MPKTFKAEDKVTTITTVPVALNKSELTVEKNDFIDNFAKILKEQENLYQQFITNNEKIFKLQTLLINNQQKLINKQKKQ